MKCARCGKTARRTAPGWQLWEATALRVNQKTGKGIITAWTCPDHPASCEFCRRFAAILVRYECPVCLGSGETPGKKPCFCDNGYIAWWVPPSILSNHQRKHKPPDDSIHLSRTTATWAAKQERGKGRVT